MAYPKEQNNQYKAEKAAGLTDAKNFMQWLATRTVEDIQQTVQETIQQIEQVEVTKKETKLPKEVKVKVTGKAELARNLYNQIEAVGVAQKTTVARKDIIKAFMEQIGLTKNGAQTYLQNIRKSKGLVSS